MSEGALHFNALLTTRDFERGIERIRNDIRRASGLAVQETSKMDNAFKSLSIGIAGYFSGQALMGFTRQLINVRGEFQKTEIALGTMLKSKEKAKALMGEMVDLAAKTPFSLQDVSAGAKQLLAFQVPANEVVDTLKRMGDIAAGLGVPLSRINLVYGQVKAKGRLMGDDLHQFTEAGIPMLAELAKKFGKTTGEIQKMVSEGKIGFKDVKEVLFSLTDEGGMFFNLMDKQSESLSGKISNLGDAFDQMLNKIGESNEGILNKGIDGAIYLVEHYEDVIKVLTILVATYGSYKAALIAISIIQKSKAIVESVSAWISLAKSIRSAKDAQLAFNLASSANPIGAILAVIGLAISVWSAYGDEIKEFIGITKEASTEMKVQERVEKELTETFSKGVAEKSAKITSLMAVINNENTKLEQRKKAYERLIAIDPAFRGTLDDQYRATAKLGDAFVIATKKMRAFALEQARMSAGKKILEESADAQMKLAMAKTKLENAMKIEADLSRRRKRREISRDKYYELRNDKLGDFDWEAARDEIKEYEKMAEEAMKKQEFVLEDNKKRVSELQKTYNKLEEAKKNAFKGYDEKDKAELIQQGENAKELLIGYGTIDEKVEETANTVEKSTKKTKKALAEVYSLNSIKDLEERISLWNNAIERASKGNDGEFKIKVRAKDKYGKEYETGKVVTKEQALAEIKALNDAKDEIERQFRQKSFDEELSELERQWRIRYQLAEIYGEEVAKAQFPKLGDSYFDDIQKMYNPLNNKVVEGIALSDTELAQWEKLEVIIKNLLGEKDPFTTWKESMDEQLKGMNTFSERLTFLNDELKNLTADDVSNGKQALLIQRINEEKEGYKELYNSFLEEHKTLEEKKTAITEKYAQLRALAETDAEKEKVNDAEKQELSKIGFDAFKNSGDWVLAFENLEYAGTETINRLIERFEAYRKAQKDNLAPTEMRELADAIQKLRQQANRNPFAKIVKGAKGYFSATKRVKKAQDDYNQALQEFGRYSKQAKKAQQELTDAELEAIKSKEALVEGLEKGQAIFNAVGEGIPEIAGMFGGLDEASQDAIEDILNVGNAALDLGTSIATGDVAGMISGGIKLISSLFDAMSGDKAKARNIKRWADEVDRLKDKYRDLERSLKDAMGQEKYEGKKQMIENLQQQQIRLQKMLDEARSKKKKDQDEIRALEEQAKQTTEAIKDLKESMADDILQTDVRSMVDEFGDALFDAWMKGVDGAEIYKNFSRDIVKRMLLEMLKAQYLMPQMKNLADGLLKMAGFNKDEKGNITGEFDGFTNDELNELQSEVDAIGSNFMNMLDGLKEIYGDFFEEMNSNNPDTLKGAIKGMSEETAGVLVGQFNAIRILQSQAVKIMEDNFNTMKASVMCLVKIEQNTYNLFQMKNDLRAIKDAVSNNNNQLRPLGL